MEATDALIVVLVIAGHVEHRHVRKRLPCPCDAFRAAVDVTGEHYYVRRNLGQFHVPEFAVKIAQNTDAHFSINRAD